MNNDIHSCENCERNDLTTEELFIIQLKNQKSFRLFFLCKDCLEKKDEFDEKIESA